MTSVFRNIGGRRVLLPLLVGLALLTGPPAMPATGGPPPLLVVNCHPVSKTPVPNSTQYDYVYRIEVKNTTPGTFYDVAGSVTSRRTSVQVRDGQASFGTVEAQKVKASSDTIAVRAHKYFDRRLDRKVMRNGRLVFEEDGTDPDDAGIPGLPSRWVTILQEILDLLFRLKATFVFNWTFTFNQDQGGPLITGQSPTGNVASDRPLVRASYQDPSGVATASVRLGLDGVDVTSQSQITASAVSFTPTTALGQGSHAVTLSVADTAGHVSSANWSFSVDSVGPVVSGQSPRDTEGARPRSTISAQYSDAGTGVDAARTVLIVDSQDVTGQATVTVVGVTYTPSTPLANGAHAVTLRAFDGVGNATEAAWSFGVDGTGPDITLTSPRDVTLAADAIPTVAASFGDTGAGVDAASVRLLVDGVDVTAGAQVTTVGLHYSPPAPLAEGPHTAQLTVADALANATTASWGFVTRSLPVISGETPKDTFVPVTAPAVRAVFTDVGSGIDAARTSLVIDGLDVTAQAVLGATGVQYAAASPWTAGLHEVAVTVFDRAGNRADASWQFRTISTPEIFDVTPSGVVLPPGTRPTITARFRDPGAPLDLARVGLLVDEFDVTALAQITPDGISYTPAEPLGPGPHAVLLNVFNSVGVAAQAIWGFDVETPSLRSITILSPAASVMVPDVEVVVLVASNRAVVDEVTVNGEGTTTAVGENGVVFTASVRLRPGPNELRAQARFDDGEVRTATLTVDYDAPPEVVIDSPHDLEVLGPVSGSSPRDLSGNVERPTTIIGRLSKPVGSVTVNQQQAVVSGLTFRFEGFFLHEGNNVVTAVATDSLGRTGTGTVTVSVDQTAPLVSVEAPVEKAVTSAAKVDVRGIVNDAVEGFANQPYPSVAVTNAANGATVVGKVADRFFIAEDVPLEVGANELRAAATDHLGNRRERAVTVTRIAVGSDRLTALSGNRQRGPRSAPLAKPLQVIAIDRSGNPLAGLPITFDVTRGTGILRRDPGDAPALAARSLVVSTDAAGRAGVHLALGKQSGEAGNMVRASHPALAEDVVFTATADRGMPAFIRADFGSNQYAEAESRAIEPFSAVVTDADENRVAGASVAFRVDEGEATFESGQPEIVVTTDRNGIAAARALVGRPGLVRATARVSRGTEPATVIGAVYLVTVLDQSDGPTQFSGRVLDHKGTPLPGVRVSLGRTALSATTDAEGNFLFGDQVPPGKLDVFIDGRTVTAGGLQYPALHFEATAVRGRRNTLPHPIALPPLLMSEAKVVGGPSDVTLTIPGFEGFEMVVKANSVTFPDGSKVGPLVVSPVHSDKLPMVPPGGYSGFMAPAWTIQPSGTRFDPPIEVKVPNTIGLEPGETREIFQWDHDLATFVAMGRATVTEDAALLVTDKGSGVSKAGWGGPPNPPPDPPKCSTPNRVCQDCWTFDAAPDVCACVRDKGKNGSPCETDRGVFGGTVFCGKCFGGGCVSDPLSDEQECCGGKKIDRNTHCCANEFPGSNLRRPVDGRHSLMWSSTSPEQCPDRTQRTNWPPGGQGDVKIDGCSVPGFAQQYAFPPGLFILPGQAPVHPLAQFFFDGCAGHDRCYQTCKSNQGVCDRQLRDTIQDRCRDAIDSSVRYTEFPGDTRYNFPLLTSCINLSDNVYYGLFLAGFAAHGERQKQTCKCCDVPAGEIPEPMDTQREY